MRQAGAGEVIAAHPAAGVGVHPANRIVLLGASNLTLSLRLAIELMQERCGGPSEVLVAAGHGRSFGKFSKVLVRGLPGVVDCGLWRQFAAGPDLPTYAFVTDIGNDIPYGHAPEDIVAWVRLCVERMRIRAAQIVVTDLPLGLIRSMSDLHFRLIRAVFFPFSRVSRTQVVRGAEIVHRGLSELADRGQVLLCEQASEWFGPDIIHILYWKRRTAYRTLFRNYSAAREECARVAGAPRATLHWARPRFACKTLFGLKRRCSQPSARLPDGTTISLY